MKLTNKANYLEGSIVALDFIKSILEYDKDISKEEIIDLIKECRDVSKDQLNEVYDEMFEKEKERNEKKSNSDS